MPNSIPFLPWSDRFLVRPDDKPKQSTGVLARPDTQKEPPTTGVVVAAGPDGNYASKIGVRVHWNKYSGTETTIDGVEYRILRHEEINGEIPEGSHVNS